LAALPTIAARDKVLELTGCFESDANAIWHHRLSDYGPPCRACGRLLRTKRARVCAACGVAV
jgi:rRNA maturation endonuclease Nob1